MLLKYFRTPPLHPNLKRTLGTLLVGSLWLAAVAYSGVVLFRYETAAGSQGNVAKVWPADARLSRATERPTLVIFAHPRCPCTRATIEELNQVMARVHGKVRTLVAFYEPSGVSGDNWTNSTLRQKAARIPGVEVVSDIDGAQAERFGAETSGHTFLFDRNGQLLFSGGITASRGHSGDNIGERTVVSLVNEEGAPLTSTLVFGCSIGARAPIERKAL